jgi:hypothetical protein
VTGAIRVMRREVAELGILTGAMGIADDEKHDDFSQGNELTRGERQQDNGR